jgi:hypothetical protein
MICWDFMLACGTTLPFYALIVIAGGIVGPAHSRHTPPQTPDHLSRSSTVQVSVASVQWWLVALRYDVHAIESMQRHAIRKSIG